MQSGGGPAHISLWRRSRGARFRYLALSTFARLRDAVARGVLINAPMPRAARRTVFQDWSATESSLLRQQYGATDGWFGKVLNWHVRALSALDTPLTIAAVEGAP